MFVFTDEPLEHHAITSSSMPECISESSDRSHSLGSTKRLRFGTFELVPDSEVITEEFQTLLPPIGSWSGYRSDNCPAYEYEEIFTYPYNDRKFLFGVEDLFFIYWYLANVGEQIAYVYGSLSDPISEMPVVRVDISDRKPGMRPLNSCRRENILYIFTDKEHSAQKHDTSLLEFMAVHDPAGSPNWRLLPENTTLNDLISMCGKCVSDIVVYDQKDVWEIENKVFKSALGTHPFELPVEFLSWYDHLWEYRGTWPWGVRSRPDSPVHGNCRAVAFSVITSDSNPEDAFLFGGDYGISLAVVISTNENL